MDWPRRRPHLAVPLPTIAVMVVVYYGFTIWTALISLPRSTTLPNHDIVGLVQHAKLMVNERRHVACINLLIFGPLLIVFCLVIGLASAILIDRDIRGEGVFRAIYLYPMSMSFIVTGLAWQRILNPNSGIEKVMRDMGWSSFSFDRLINSDKAVHTLVIAGVRRAAGLVMALFLAGPRGADTEIRRAARVRETAERMGHRPDPRGVNLGMGKTNNVCTVVPIPDEDGLGDIGTVNLIAGVSVVLRRDGLSPMVAPRAPDEDDLTPIRHVVEARLADAVIFQRTRPRDPRVGHLIEKKLPFVLFGRTETFSPHAFVDVDHETLVYRSAERLFEGGHRVVALINGLRESEPGRTAKSVHGRRGAWTPRLSET